ncbi:MAG: flagellar biosynthesis protein [Solirubrobacteraceae bacterium]|nr:flagellar biosynthesis protein [Solirubrobacteraceae bacterium]
MPPGVGGPAPVAAPTAPARPTAAPKGPAFGDVLAKEASSLQFSGHAIQRLQKRGIELDQQTIQRLEGAVEKAAQKGSRDSVVFVDSTAFVVSVKNNTVITAMDKSNMREHVFTNIDSAVIA